MVDDAASLNVSFGARVSRCLGVEVVLLVDGALSVHEFNHSKAPRKLRAVRVPGINPSPHRFCSPDHPSEARVTHHPGHPTTRRDALKCMAWAGTGALWALNGGVASSTMLGATQEKAGGFTFLQISDSHVG